MVCFAEAEEKELNFKKCMEMIIDFKNNNISPIREVIQLTRDIVR